jgi:hypothetical protein
VKRLRSRLTYANVVSTVALFLVVAGGTAFAATQMLPKNSVGSKQIKKNAVTAAKIKNGAVTGAKIDLSSLGNVPNATHATSADTATNATYAVNAVNAAKAVNATNALEATNATTATNAGNADALGGKPASAYALSTIVRSVTLKSNGTVDAARSDGVTQANVTHAATGFYCISGLDPAPKAAIAQAAYGAEYHVQIFTKPSPELGEVCPGSQIGIAVYNESDAPSDNQLVVLLH